VCLSTQSLAYCLALVAGWLDVICIKQYRCFANMMSGNTVKMAEALASSGGADAILLAAVVLAYCAGHALFTYSDRKMAHTSYDAAGLAATARGTTWPALPFIVMGLFVLADNLCRYVDGSARAGPRRGGT
jgi:uncharacterized membrane protein YoaK (UPF0700 family)